MCHPSARQQKLTGVSGRLYLKDDILVRRYYLNEGPEFYPQIILLQVFWKSVMHQMYEGPVGRHFRVERTLERIAVDLMGPMNETEHFNRYILIAQDYFTKWVEAYPLPSDQAVTVAEIIVSEWVYRYGAPSISDGQVERFNATLQKILAMTSKRCHWEWDLMVPYAVMVYQATKHSSTGFTPNMMLFGREITEPIDLVVGKPPNDTLTQSILTKKIIMHGRLELPYFPHLTERRCEKSPFSPIPSIHFPSPISSHSDHSEWPVA
ncbi:Retrovirus-related Pol polyprotein [Labeo rohita]|uniref:Retrovirus-related Pol polyprotein n=1 Tax=Labeo rohita TaxID=84645 RepID=A0ABQ8LJH7_LABRO|nr:Retrovirus-related Pol polyprotein [Labeo rohita]